MGSRGSSSLLAFLLFLSILHAASAQEKFLECLVSNNINSISDVIYTPSNSSYSSVLLMYIQNLRFISPDTPKPQVIVMPVCESDVGAVIFCSKEHGLQLRIRSGGHDSEGLSYVSHVPFVLLDMSKLRSIVIDVEDGSSSAWVQTGATLGELYHSIFLKNRTLTFAAALGASIGVGGHVSGGGYGNFIRKYGTAADNVVDARLMDTTGRILDRKSMGEDLFWAIRGGGGSSFGVILAYKLKLVPVPDKLTLFEVHKTLDENATKILHRWQYVAPMLDKDLTIRISIVTTKTSENDNTPKVVITFISTFLGGVDRLLKIMHEKFPELGLGMEHCKEMRWIDTILHFNDVSGEPLDVLLDRNRWPKTYLKVKSDYVTKAVAEQVFKGLCERLLQVPTGAPEITLAPYGGRMDEIPESEVAFPHRAGNLFLVFYGVYWEKESSPEVIEYRLRWITSLYKYMTPFVSSSPRAAFFPYRDLDLGSSDTNSIGMYQNATFWGKQYFKENFNRLVQVKTKFDPHNFFRDEQSIPPLMSSMAE